MTSDVLGAFRIMRNSRVGDKKRILVRRKRKTIRLVIIIGDPLDLTRWMDTIDMAGADLAGSAVAFIIHQDSVARVRKPDRSIRFHHHVIRRI